MSNKINLLEGQGFAGYNQLNTIIWKKKIEWCT